MNEELLKRLDVLAAKLGVASAQIWQCLLLQSRIEAITDIGILCLCCGSFFVFRAWGRKIVSGNWDEAAWLPLTALACVTLIVACVVSSDIATELFNPQYFALNRILKSLK
jgi:hypothetical protein